MADYQAHAARITKITLLSPLAKAQLDSEGYRLALETDAVTDRSVLEVLFGCLIQDMYELGIEWACPPGALFADFHQLDEFLALCEMLLPNTLYPKLRADPKLRSTLAYLLSGGPGDDDDTLVSYLKWLGLDDDRYSDRYRRAVEEALEHAQSSPVFDEYLTNLLALDESILAVADLDLERHGDYQAQVVALTAALQRGLAALATRLPAGVCPHGELSRRITLYVQQLTAPEHVNQLAWLFAPATVAELGTEVWRLRAQRLREWASGSKLHVEYYVANRVALTPKAVLSLALRLYATAADQASYRRQVDELRQTLSRAELALPQHLNNLLAIAVSALADTLPA